MRMVAPASTNPVWTKAVGLACLALLVLVGSGPRALSVPLVRAQQDAPNAKASNGFPAEVRARLSQLEQWVHQRGGKLSAHLVDIQSGAELGSGEGDALNPASNMKLITAAFALERLGAGFSFQTGLYGQMRGGVAEQLVLRGNGDPSLTESALWRLANSVANQGLTRVDQLLVDQSRFDDQFVPPAFEQQPDEWAAFRAPVSAIALERNSITLNVLPARAGEPARVWFEPTGAAQVAGQIETAAPGRGQSVQLRLESATPGRLIGHVGGKIAAGLGRQRYTKRLEDPRLVPGLVLAELLRQCGVSVEHVALGGSDVRTRITYHGSPPLAELLPQLGKYSDNFYAEMIFKAFSRQDSDAPASSQRSARLVMDWLEQIGASTEGARIENGSGLFDANRLSAVTLTRVLHHSYQSRETRVEMLSQLAVGGVAGTLRNRFRQPETSGRVRAKTGTLRDSITLSGYYLRTARRAPIAFALLVNGIEGQHAAIRRQLDSVVESLSAAN